jgi:hypothetical protein
MVGRQMGSPRDRCCDVGGDVDLATRGRGVETQLDDPHRLVT